MIGKINSINVDHCINSGQVFLWDKIKENWYGVNGEEILRIDSAGKIQSSKNQDNDFFRKQDDLPEIFKKIKKDAIVKQAVKEFLGLRILRQDPFQCYISFIVSSNSNIMMIRKRLKLLCQKFGKKLNCSSWSF